MPEIQYSSWGRPETLQWKQVEYNTWADSYYPLIKKWLPENKKAMIGDVGCGVGNLLWLLAREDYSNISGVDSDPQQVELAKRIARADCQDALAWLEAKPNTFDV